MRVLIVNTNELNGGAAIAASRLMEALNNHGVKAKMLVQHKQSDALNVSQTGSRLGNKWNFLMERGMIWLCNGYDRANLFKVSIANTGTDITHTAEFQEADIIHLHWINQGFLSLRTIRKILQSGKPVVWTMHDMWPFTAICHHAYTCRNFESSCHDCMFLKSHGRNDLSARVFRKKEAMFRDAPRLTFVAVSEWLASRARSSMLTRSFPVKVIPNTISLSDFTLTDRNDARSALDIRERYVVSFGAARIDEPIKGFDYLLQALRLITDRQAVRPDELRLLLFGNIRQPELLRQIPVAYTHLGYVDDESQLSLIYSASNATVSASHYETFGQTLVEAQACGALPIAFKGSGPDDIIRHKENGFLADYLSAESLADGILWALKADTDAHNLRRNVSRRFSENSVALRYAELYNAISHHD